MLKLALVVTAVALMMSFAIPVSAASYYGPSFSTPTAISPGSNINILLSTVSSSTFVAPPAGSNAPCSAGTCSYPLQSCTNPAAFYIAIHSIVVTDPNGNQFKLGSATGSGLYWPANQGGGNSNNGPSGGVANELNITASQSDMLVFGTGAGGSTFASENYVTSAPFTAISNTAGPYYWWTVAGNQYGSNLRLDQNPSIMPTMTHGTYQVDIEGVAVCGTTTSSIHAVVFFDAGIIVVTPEFGASIVAVAAVAFLLVMLARQGIFGRKVNIFPRTN